MSSVLQLFQYRVLKKRFAEISSKLVFKLSKIVSACNETLITQRVSQNEHICKIYFSDKKRLLTVLFGN